MASKYDILRINLKKYINYLYTLYINRTILRKTKKYLKIIERYTVSMDQKTQNYEDVNFSKIDLQNQQFSKSKSDTEFKKLLDDSKMYMEI